MTGGWMLRHRAALAVAALVMTLASAAGLAPPARAQSANDAAELKEADALAERASDLYDAGKYAEAEPLYVRSLAIREKVLGPEHLDVATSLNNLALLYVEQGRYAEAEPLFKRDLAMSEKLQGPDHPDVATTLDNLASLYMSQARYAEAEPLIRRSLAIREKALGPEHPDVASSLNTLAELYESLGRYAEAEGLLERDLAISVKAQGPDHPDVAATLCDLGDLYARLGRYAEAEPLYLRSLAIREKALGPEHPDVAISLNGLAGLYESMGRYAEAEPLLKRDLAISVKAQGPDHPGVATTLSDLAGLYRDLGRYAEAEPLILRSLAIREKSLGPDHPDVARSLNSLAGLYQALGRYAEAEPLLKRDLAISEKVQGPDHPDVAATLGSLASLYQDLGRYAEAEPLILRSLAIREKALGPDHPEVAKSLNRLAGLYQSLGRYAEAEPLLKRDLAISEKVQGPDHPDVAVTLSDLAGLYWYLGRYAEAEPLAQRSLAIREKALGPDHPGVATALMGLAELYRAQRRFAEAEPLYHRSLTIREKVLGPEHPVVAATLNNLALLYEAQGRYAEAEPLLERDLAIYQKTVGAEHPYSSTALNNLALIAFDRGDWAGAADYWRRAGRILQRRAELGLAGGQGEDFGKEALRSQRRFVGLLKMTYRLPDQRASAAAEMFETAQWVESPEAAASLAQMAARSAGGSPKLAVLVRQRQDLVSEWRVKDKLLIAAKSKEPSTRKPLVEKALADRLAAIDANLAGIDQRLAREFPHFAEWSRPVPLSVADVQAELRGNEALVLFSYTSEWKPLPEETFIWVVTKSAVRWVRSDLGAIGLVREVGALRCGLDEAAWDGEGKERCATALGIPVPKETPYPLPFDHSRAHRLYLSLFGQIEDLIKGKNLLIVPDGALTQLPFQVLVTDEVRPSGSDTVARPSNGRGPADAGTGPAGPEGRHELPASNRTVAWLVRKHAVTILPAVSSLKALRRVGRPSTAPRPMIGFGNPLLDGYPGAPDDDEEAAERARDDAAQAERARRLRSCRDTGGGAQLASRPGAAHGGIVRVATRGGGLASLAQIKMQTPLPETADELCTVARAVQADVSAIHLGAQATEREVKRLSASGELAKYRIVHFATHGVLAGQILRGREDQGGLAPLAETASADAATSRQPANEEKFLREPGLVLTPPANATEEDDGFLSASEIAGLKLDADWVILSACNTAAGAAPNAEALSGLARAFIYAQARALLVSHWAVYSEATKKLITGAVGAMAGNPGIGRAEALRRAMLALIDKGTALEAHPSFWAPFVLVGEGAPPRRAARASMLRVSP